MAGWKMGESQERAMSVNRCDEGEAQVSCPYSRDAFSTSSSADTETGVDVIPDDAMASTSSRRIGFCTEEDASSMERGVLRTTGRDSNAHHHHQDAMPLLLRLK